MPISSPKALHEFLNEIGAKPQKKLSQNFLIDQNILNKIASVARLEKGDQILEIGSGPGALTETLLAHGASVIAVEKDHLFATHLHRFHGVEVFEGDIRDFDFKNVSREKKLKVVANLPYSLTSPILGLLAPQNALFSQLTLMVQDEVAKRMVAKPSTSDYSSLTVFLNFYAEVHYAFKVSRRCFYPVPKVDSAIVTLNLVQREVPFEIEGFFATVRKAFQQRRKMLRRSLRGLFPVDTIEGSLSQLGLKKEVRTEELSLNQWVAFYEGLLSLQLDAKRV